MSRTWKSSGYVWLLGLGLLLAACSTLPDPGPVLVEEITLAPTLPVTPQTATPRAQETEATFTPTVTVITEVPEVQTEVAFDTPTLPPSKTPTPSSTATVTSTFTPTFTWTPSLTPTQSTPLPTATLPPTSVGVPGQGGVGQVPGLPAGTLPPPGAGQTPLPGISGPPVVVAGTPGAPVNTAGGCLYFWFFSSLGVPYCPASPPLTGTAVYLPFENGVMMWFELEDMIYVLYNDAQVPRWGRYQDTWAEGMPERDPTIVAPPNFWQPRRGFGELWRTNLTVQARLGWATAEWEEVYEGIIQRAGPEGAGAVYLTDNEGRGYQLFGDQSQWRIFRP